MEICLVCLDVLCVDCCLWLYLDSEFDGVEVCWLVGFCLSVVLVVVVLLLVV